MRLLAAVFAFGLAAASGADNRNAISLGEAAEHAVEQSRLTLAGSKPFHLVAEIVEVTNPKSDYRAKVDEYWVAPDRWRRTIESPEFSQTLIVNGDKVSEKDTGDYFPWWLNDLVTAMVDPLPMAEMLKQTNAQVQKPQAGQMVNSCVRLTTKIDNWTFCFEGERGLLSSVFARGFDAEFRDYKGFGEKQVARTLVIDPEPGTTIEAKVKHLEELSHPDEAMFVVDQPTPPQDRIRSVKVDQETVRRLATTSTEVTWPTVGEGPTKGGCAVYVSADRNGNIREVWPHGCDNAGLQDPLREMVRKWRLKPAIEGGTPVQVESLVTFSFETQTEKSKTLPVLTDAEARNLATDIVEPVFPPGSVAKGQQIVVQISVNETGKLTGVGNSHNLSTPAFLAADAALKHWHFKPYIKDGKAQYFHADVIFRNR
jgi:hypothetical protein